MPRENGEVRNGRIFDMLPDSKIMFDELIDWYLNLESVRRLAGYKRAKFALNNLKKVIGNRKINTLKPIDLENYQMLRINQGIAKITIDNELMVAKTMINKAFDNDLIGGRILKTFRKTKQLSKKSERIRERVLSIDEYIRLLKAAAPHLRNMLIVSFNTGMRPGEIAGLRWKYIDWKNMFIRLPAKVTKERASKKIPINRYVKEVLKSMPRHINHDFVFTYRGRPLSLQAGPSDAFKNACRKANIPYGKKHENGIIPHDFRRTFKTN
jgi:integrase